MKKRVVIWYDNSLGRNDGPPLFYFNQLQKRDDIEVIHAIPNGDNENVGKVDLNIWVDWGEDSLKGLLPYDPVFPDNGAPTAYVGSDTHLGKDYRFEMADKADYVFFNQKRAVEEYLADRPEKTNVQWLPHAFEPACYRPGVWTGKEWIEADPKKEYDVCFIGHIQMQDNYNGISRVAFLDKMFAAFPDRFYYGSRNPAFPGYNLFDDVAGKFNRSKIVLNISIGDDLNMRLFEALGTNSLLLTNWLPTLEDIFVDNKDLISYKTVDEAVEKAQYFIDNPDEAEMVAESGYKKVLSKHTYMHRVETVLKTCGII